jgi:tRNA(Glu) U13 pseudouridine synthase TruD
MNTEITKDELREILYHAYRCLMFNEVIINQSSRWLSEEEGNANVMAEIKARKQLTINN